jgi:hypothetical protein
VICRLPFLILRVNLTFFILCVKRVYDYISLKTVIFKSTTPTHYLIRVNEQNRILKMTLHKKYVQNNNYDLQCDECGSFNIDNDSGEYVCKSCGLVLRIQKLEYHKPYKEEKIQNSILGATKIGFRRERMKNRHSIQLQRLNRIHSVKDSAQTANYRIQIEIARILNVLNLPISQKNILVKKAKAVRNSLSPGTKFRNPDKLIPVVIYVHMKFQKICLNKDHLLEISKVSKKDFNSFLFTIQKFFPKYDEEKKKAYILQKVMEISEVFDLGMEFYFLSKKILYNFWDSIKCTKEDVITGLVSAISVLCNYRDMISVNAICKKLNIRMSTIHSQVERKIFNALRIPGFKSLVKSADLLKKIMEKLGIITHNVEKEEEGLEENKKKDKSEDKTIDHKKQSKKKYPVFVLVKIKELTKRYNSDYRNHYIIAVKDHFENLILIQNFIKSPSFSEKKAEGCFISDLIVIPELDYIKLKNTKGPP